jgi:hypothetical protein
MQPVGWYQVEYEELAHPIRPQDDMDILAPLLPEEYAPIRTDGGGNQVYLAEIPERAGKASMPLIGRQLVRLFADRGARLGEVGPCEPLMLFHIRPCSSGPVLREVFPFLCHPASELRLE